MAATADVATAFVGRVEVLDALRREGESLRRGSGRLTLLFGDAGVGKSTLARAITRELAGRGLTVYSERAPAVGDPPPLGLIRRALGGAPARPGRALSEEGSLAFAPSQAYALEPATGPEAELGLPALSGEDRLLETIAGGEGTSSTRERLFAGYAERLLDRTVSGPVLFILEDLQYADLTSLEFLEYLRPFLDRHRLWVLGTATPPALLPEPIRGSLERLARLASTPPIELRPLTMPEVEELVRALAPGVGIAPEEITRWHSQTGGNPQFIEELLRRRQEPIGAPAVEPAGLDLADYLSREVAGLPEPVRHTLDLMAVLGREFPFALLLRASGEREEALAELLDLLIHRGLIREDPDERIEFVREDLRASLYHRLIEPRRRLLHRRAGEALEALGLTDEAAVFSLARHFYLGKVDDRAAVYNRLAADIASRAFSPQVAREHLERAIECHRHAHAGDPLGAIDLDLELAAQLGRLGELAGAERTLRETLDRLPAEPSGPQRRLAHLALARVLTDQGRWDEADRITGALLQESDLPTAIAAAIHRMRGEVAYFRGDYPASLAEHDRALALVEKGHDPRELARESVRRANVLAMIPGRLDEALATYRSASEELARHGDRGEAAYARLFLGVTLAQHGRLPASLRELEEALALAEAGHDQRRIGWALFNAADVLRELGELPEAERRNQRAREVLERIGDRFGLLQTLIVRGKISLANGRTSEAELAFLEAYGLVRELRTPADEIEVLLRLAEVARNQGDRAGVAKRLAELTRWDVGRIRPDLLATYRQLTEEAGGPHRDPAGA